MWGPASVLFRPWGAAALGGRQLGPHAGARPAPGGWGKSRRSPVPALHPRSVRKKPELLLGPRSQRPIAAVTGEPTPSSLIQRILPRFGGQKPEVCSRDRVPSGALEKSKTISVRSPASEGRRPRGQPLGRPAGHPQPSPRPLPLPEGPAVSRAGGSLQGQGPSPGRGYRAPFVMDDNVIAGPGDTARAPTGY